MTTVGASVPGSSVAVARPSDEPAGGSTSRRHRRVGCKRGNDTFRLRCAADVTDEAAAKATFDTFTRGFVLLNV